MNHIIGLDIGGANLKAAHSDGPCRSRYFPLWESPERLAGELSNLIGDWLPCAGLAVTMTGELADCFESKAEGVNQILTAVEKAANRTPIAVWQTVGEFVDAETAREFWQLTAAANWHAQATFVGRVVPTGSALLIDVGSTTTDIIPLQDGLPNPTGRTDSERLISGELVYSGVRRTPLCAVAHSVPIEHGDTAKSYSQLAAELFANTLDVYLLLGDITENSEDLETANGRSATVVNAHNRLARQLCCDRSEVSLDEARSIATFLAGVQRQRITGAIDRVLSTLSTPCGAVIVSGEGSFLTKRILDAHARLKDIPRHSLMEMFSVEASTAACAFALARLASERPGTFTDEQFSSLLTP
ncbi:MAG: H4MPT-linked C1 transfer pathway protein [Planctomycetota bacterium]|nr:H4MPT-linked C1 transfer pathway protein [Planctomycetota bacterium]MDA1163582.1 H4MPT-linked C1 transfer pathway protein [Planctomycetota bacterium]